jgi:hypothetical protein
VAFGSAGFSGATGASGAVGSSLVVGLAGVSLVVGLAGSSFEAGLAGAVGLFSITSFWMSFGFGTGLHLYLDASGVSPLGQLRQVPSF